MLSTKAACFVSAPKRSALVEPFGDIYRYWLGDRPTSRVRRSKVALQPIILAHSVLFASYCSHSRAKRTFGHRRPTSSHSSDTRFDLECLQSALALVRAATHSVLRVLWTPLRPLFYRVTNAQGYGDGTSGW